MKLRRAAHPRPRRMQAPRVLDRHHGIVTGINDEGGRWIRQQVRIGLQAVVHRLFLDRRQRRLVGDDRASPGIGRNRRIADHQHVGPRCLEPLADVVKSFRDRCARGRRQRVPLAGNHRPVTGGKDSDETSHVTLAP